MTPELLSPRAEMRLFVGLLLQPILAAALTYAAFPLIDYTGRPLYGGRASDSADAALALSLGVGVVAALVTIVGVFPAVVWLVKRIDVTFGRAILGGVLFGNLPVVIGTLLAGSYGPAGFLRAAVMGTTLGICGAALFWVISIRGHHFRAFAERQ
jgi:hypothetical protein